MPRLQILHRSRAVAIVALAAMLGLARPAAAAPITPELQQRVRAATFEVVLPKPAEDTVTYERPLPLDLIPYAERTDRYWSIGTAVAIGPNRFVSASHVIAAGVGREAGPPGLRDSSGTVHAIDRVLQYSLAEDYVVFSLAKPPADLQPLPTSTAYAVDDVVYAVGNALGEGVVIRDGLLTSLTPEQRDNRWKWLRFSAATSPGNSGGPLLDSEGRVIGVVTAKSPNENLNYALPIERVLQGSTEQAAFEMHEPFAMPMLRDSVVADYQSSFPLPASYETFSRRLLDLSGESARSAETKLFREQGGELFPRGESAEFFAETYRRSDPSYLAQQDDKRWGLASTAFDFETPLPANGRVWTSMDPRFNLFRIQYPDDATDARRYEDSKAFMDVLLKALRLQRLVGTQQIRIASLGPATQSTEYRDAQRRVWQVRTWRIPMAELTVRVYALPTPDGYAGLAMQYFPLQEQASDQQMRRLADYFFVSYTGTLPQWRAYLARKPLRAAAFDHVEVANDAAKGFVFRSPRLSYEVPRAVMAFDDSSRLKVLMSYVQRGDGADWDSVGTVLEPSPTDSSALRILRQARPATGVKRELQHRWEQMESRTGDFSGVARRADDQTQYWFRTVAAPKDPATAQRVLYEVEYSIYRATTPRDLEDRRDLLLPLIKVSEP